MSGRLNTYLAVLIFLAVAFCFGATPLAQGAERLVIATWGGMWGDSLTKNVLDPFKKEHGVEVAIHRQTSASDTLAKLRAEKDKPTIDIYFATWGGATAMTMEGLALEITEKDVPELVNISPNLVGKYDGNVHWLGIHPMSIGLSVRRDLVKVPKEVTLKWLQDASLKGLIAIPRLGWGHAAVLIHCALAGGGNENNIEPGFDFAHKIASNIRVIYGTTGEAIRLLTSGEVAIALTNSNAPAKMLQSGLNVGFYNPKDAPVYLTSDAVLAIKGGPGGKELALKFLNYLMDPMKIGNYSYGVGSSSPNVKSPPAPKDKVPFPVAATELTSGYFPNNRVVSENLDKWNERWEKEIVPAIGK